MLSCSRIHLLPGLGGFPELAEVVHLLHEVGKAARCQRKFCRVGGKVKGSVAKAPRSCGRTCWHEIVKEKQEVRSLKRRGLVLWDRDMPGPRHSSGRKHGHNGEQGLASARDHKRLEGAQND